MLSRSSFTYSKKSMQFIKVPSEETEKVMLKVNKAGIKRVWLQQGSQSEKAINFSQENGIYCVSDECILMLS